jgi:epoxyqueuosine reductase QueG
MISFALPIPSGVYSVSQFNSEFVWRAQNLMYRQLDTHSLNISIILENEGYTALPIHGCLPTRYNSKKEFAGHINQLDIGRLTGIGFIGKNGLLLNSLYGSRMMLGAVLTSADLEPVCEPDTSENDCPEGCGICSRVCPVNAIILKERRVNIMKCLYYTSKVHFLPKIRFFILRSIKPESSVKLFNRTCFDDLAFHICSRCVSECPYGQKDIPGAK